jgi:hypothetical protein
MDLLDRYPESYFRYTSVQRHHLQWSVTGFSWDSLSRDWQSAEAPKEKGMGFLDEKGFCKKRVYPKDCFK